MASRVFRKLLDPGIEVGINDEAGRIFRARLPLFSERNRVSGSSRATRDDIHDFLTYGAADPRCFGPAKD